MGEGCIGPVFPSCLWLGWGAGGLPLPPRVVLKGICTGPSEGLGFFGFAAHIPSLAGTRLLFLHFKLLLQRANTVCKTPLLPRLPLESDLVGFCKLIKK